jgi:hypothetical protein
MLDIDGEITAGRTAWFSSPDATVENVELNQSRQTGMCLPETVINIPRRNDVIASLKTMNQRREHG